VFSIDIDMTQTNSPVILFDTKLRNGGQSPYASMRLGEMWRMAHVREDLGIDAIEAGSPIAVNRSFEALRKITTIVTTISHARAFDGAQSADSVPGAVATANLNELLLEREKSISALSA
jgi:isopropylmalate/homocitrate/citramalate synthase